MFITRNGQTPTIHPSTVVASSAQIIGNVSIGESCYIDYNVVIESSDTPIEIADHVIVLANSVIRSVSGAHRPANRTDHTLISPYVYFPSFVIEKDIQTTRLMTAAVSTCWKEVFLKPTSRVRRRKPGGATREAHD